MNLTPSRAVPVGNVALVLLAASAIGSLALEGCRGVDAATMTRAGSAFAGASDAGTSADCGVPRDAVRDESVSDAHSNGRLDPSRVEHFMTRDYRIFPEECHRDPPPAGAHCPRGMVVVPPSVRLSWHDKDRLVEWSCSHKGAFCMDVHEVTVAQYHACLTSAKCPRALRCLPRAGSTDDYPIDCAAIYQAKAYCAIHGKRLPTSEEWEAAADDHEHKSPPWGVPLKQIPPDGICFNREEVWKKPLCPVGSSPFDRNWLGIYDMAGNATEWVTRSFSEAAIVPGGWSAPMGEEWGISAKSREEGAGSGVSAYDGRNFNAGIRCVRSLGTKGK